MLAPKRSRHPQGQDAVVEFTALISEAWRLRSKPTLNPAPRRNGASFHKACVASATLAAGISPVVRQPGQVPGAASKADGTRKGLECESSANRQHRRGRRAS